MAKFECTAALENLKARADLLTWLRRFFAQRKVLEVETPILSSAGNSDPAIVQFETAGQSKRWLRSSPEYAIKRLLACGVGDCFELGRVFRAGESGRHHNPEFTLLEWYRLGWDYHRLMDEAAQLVQQCGKHWGHQWTVRKLTYAQWFEQEVGLPVDSNPRELAMAANRPESVCTVTQQSCSAMNYSTC